MNEAVASEELSFCAIAIAVGYIYIVCHFFFFVFYEWHIVIEVTIKYSFDSQLKSR